MGGYPLGLVIRVRGIVLIFDLRVLLDFELLVLVLIDHLTTDLVLTPEKVLKH